MDTLTTQMFTQIVVNAILLSLLYMLMATGLTLIFSVMGLINFAHGELYMLGGFAIYFVSGLMGLQYWWGLLVGIVFAGLFGILLEKSIFRPLRKNLVQASLASLGVGLILQTVILLLFGGQDRAVPRIFDQVLEISGIFIPLQKLFTVGASALVAAALIFFVNHSQTGLALQAVAQDDQAAVLQGINVGRMNAIGFGIGCALAAAAGGLISPLYSISPYMGVAPVFKAFIVIIMGGLGSIPGAVLASFILGFIEQFSLTLIGYAGNILGFVIVMILLLFRPRGLLGREFRVD